MFEQDFYDSYAFHGRIPRSILARHCIDLIPEKLKEIYDGVNIKVWVRRLLFFTIIGRKRKKGEKEFLFYFLILENFLR